MDGGASWAQGGTGIGLYWATIFAHDGALYLQGTTGDNRGKDVGLPGVGIARSDDCGITWGAMSEVRVVDTAPLFSY